MWYNLISGTAHLWRCFHAMTRMSSTKIMFLCCKTHVSTGEVKNKIRFLYLPTDTWRIVQNIEGYFQPIVDRILADSLVLCRKELSTNPP